MHAIRQNKRVLRTTLTLAALFYPAHVVAQLAWIVTGLWNQAVWGERILRWDLGVWTINLQTEEIPDTADRLVHFVACLLLAWICRKGSPVFGGLLAAVAGLASFRRTAAVEQTDAVGQLIPALVLLVIGARWLCGSVNYPSRWSAATSLALGIGLTSALLPPIVFGWIPWSGGFQAAIAYLAFLGLSFLPVFLIAAVMYPQINEGAQPGTRWSTIAIGVGLSIVLLVSLTQTRRWIDEKDQAAARNVLASLPSVPKGAPYPTLRFHRGMTLVADRLPFGSTYTRSLVLELKEYGVDSIALVAWRSWVRNPMRMLGPRQETEKSDLQIEALSRFAHANGLNVMLKPHGWRASKNSLSTDRDRKAWFRAYRDYALHYARLAEKIHADVFCIGTELGWLSEHEGEWRALIEEVRTIYPGPLTYAANHGPEFESVRFWDALDYIGLDAYYPLPDDFSTDEILNVVEQVQRSYGKPVLFTEAGYSSFSGAHRRPWQDGGSDPVDLHEQSQAYEALLSTFYHKPWFSGVYWWKIETGGQGGADDNSILPWRKPAMEVVRRWYKTPRD